MTSPIRYEAAQPLLRIPVVGLLAFFAVSKSLSG
jgi:hypothetical protein